MGFIFSMTIATAPEIVVATTISVGGGGTWKRSISSVLLTCDGREVNGSGLQQWGLVIVYR